MSNSLRPHESQHVRPPCPSPTSGVYSNSCQSSRWYHPAILSSAAPFSSCPQSLLASGSFQMSQLFAWGGQSTGVSALASFLPKNTQDWSPSEWTGWISLQSKGLSRVFSKPKFKSINSSALSFLHSPVLIRDTKFSIDIPYLKPTTVSHTLHKYYHLSHIIHLVQQLYILKASYHQSTTINIPGLLRAYT